jgi:rod shape-determining protein MreD
MAVVLPLIFIADISRITPSGAKPDLFLLAVLCFCILSKRDTFLFAAAAGLLKDIVSSTPIGFHMLTFSILALGVGKLRQLIFIDNILLFPALIFVLSSFVTAFCGLVTGTNVETVVHISAVNGIITLWLSLFVFVLVRLCRIAGYRSPS